jgi:CubicO group peptidase (beta-lactamase class C family)
MSDPSALQLVLDQAVAAGVFPGAQLSVRTPSLALDLCAGLTALPRLADSAPVTPDTRFDIASLTKALSTSVLLMQAVDELGLDLERSVEAWFPSLDRAAHSAPSRWRARPTARRATAISAT